MVLAGMEVREMEASREVPIGTYGTLDCRGELMLRHGRDYLMSFLSEEIG